jgi:hypothetical protein
LLHLKKHLLSFSAVLSQRFVQLILRPIFGGHERKALLLSPRVFLLNRYPAAKLVGLTPRGSEFFGETLALLGQTLHAPACSAGLLSAFRLFWCCIDLIVFFVLRLTGRIEDFFVILGVNLSFNR